MKQTFLSILIVCGFFAASNAQNNLFSNISTTDVYHRFSSIQDTDGDGKCVISDRDLAVKFNTKSLVTGESYWLEAIIEEGSEKGESLKKMDAVHGYSTCVGYPYESVIRHSHSKDAIVAIDDYVFVLYKFSDDGISFKGVRQVFIKVKQEAETESEEKKDTKGKKKKMSMKDRLKALEELKSKLAVNYGAAHKELQNKDLKKYITDYLVAMKAKQDGRTAAEKKHDDNLEAAKKRDAAETKAYNDKIKASPEYKRMKEYQKFSEEAQRENNANSVTIENKTGQDIYIYEGGFSNGTVIRVGSNKKFNCKYNYSYRFNPNTSGSASSCYSANSKCGGSITVN